jgi:hypothetical protein
MDTTKKWNDFNIHVPIISGKLFNIATASVVGGGATTLFWLVKEGGSNHLSSV